MAPDAPVEIPSFTVGITLGSRMVSYTRPWKSRCVQFLAADPSGVEPDWDKSGLERPRDVQ